MLLVADVKQNRLYYAWLTPDGIEGRSEAQTIGIPFTEINVDVKRKLTEQLANQNFIEQAAAGISLL